MAENLTEWLKDGDRALALIVRAEFKPDKTTFLTSDEFSQQLGFVVYGANKAIPPHEHLPIKRELTGTAEVLLVKSGRMLVDLYSESRRLVATREVKTGDVILLFGSGHGFRMLEDTVLLEVKQGPYTGLEEKERFDP